METRTENPISIKEIATALSKAQAEILEAELDCKNPHYNSSYASLSSVWRACRAALTKHGLSVVQGVENGPDKTLFLETKLMHSSGEQMSFMCPLLVDKQNMQGLGSAITYAKRYSLAAIAGVVDEGDDDGNAAAKAPPQKSEPEKKFSDRKPPGTPPPEFIVLAGKNKGQKISTVNHEDMGRFITWTESLEYEAWVATHTVAEIEAVEKTRDEFREWLKKGQ